MDIFTLIKSVKLYEERNHMNQRFLVNKVIALLNFGQTQVLASIRFDV